MSIFFNIGRNTTPDFVELDVEFITVKNLKNLISKKIGVKEEDMKIKNVISFVEYAPNEYIKKGSSVSVDIVPRNIGEEPLRFHEIISNQRLEAMFEDCRFYVAKSSNEDNIEKARECSVWATTYLNQDKFKNAFQCYKHIFLFFGTNRSFELKGLARMESEPDKVPDKSIWNGVSNIRLGGNFKIRWIRKKPLSLTTIERKLGADARDEISKATDGYEPQKQIAKKIALLFELPSEPYYKLEQLNDKKDKGPQSKFPLNMLNRPNDLFHSQLASVMLKNIESARIDQLGLVDDNPKPVIMQQVLQKPKKKGSSPPKKSKHKSKKKKHKKGHKKRRYSSSSRESRSRSRSIESSSSSSDSSSKQVRRRRQKDRPTQKRFN